MFKELMLIENITFMIKIFITNFCIYYASNRIINEKSIKNAHIIFWAVNIIISMGHTILKLSINTILLPVVMYLLFAIVISKIFKRKIGYSLIVILISFAVCNISLLIGTFVGFAPYKTILKENEIYGTLISSIIQFVLVYLFFKIKRFKNGFGKLYEKLNKESVDTLVIYISISIVMLACFMGCVFFEPEDIMKNTFITFIVLGITTYIMIQRTITMQYKHSLLLKTLEEYKEEIESKDKEIEKLSAEKFNTSKIRHEFYNRQKALELMVKQNMSDKINTDGASENILKIVNELTTEYSKECEIVKRLAALPKTEVVEIDNMFKYMQTECAKNNIEFKINIQDSIHPLINNHISKNRLETLLGDHIRNAINVLNRSDVSNKEILIILGLKDGNYEICILDNGLEFNIDVLLKLGKEQVTTGGTGIGFLTTFETLKETKASLVITEFETGEYTKAIAFVFDDKCSYVINSYRVDGIKNLNNREDIIINKLEG